MTCYLATTWSCSAAAFPLCHPSPGVPSPSHHCRDPRPGLVADCSARWLGTVDGSCLVWFLCEAPYETTRSPGSKMLYCSAELSWGQNIFRVSAPGKTRPGLVQVWSVPAVRTPLFWPWSSQSYCPFSDHLQIFLSILLRNLIASQIFLLLSLEKKNSALLFLNSGNA